MCHGESPKVIWSENQMAEAYAQCAPLMSFLKAVDMVGVQVLNA
jgi:hypothetical protein